MNDDIEKVLPFDSFSAICKILGWTGFYRVLNNPTSGYKRIFYKIYKQLAFLITLIYNLLHLIFTAQNIHNSERLMEVLMIEVPQMNLVMKVATVYFQTARIDNLNSFLRDDHTFRASDAAGQSILQQNKKEMHQLTRFLMIFVTGATLSWPISFFVRRYNDPDEVVPAYVPFETNTWAKFSLSVFLECSPMLWIGYGHLSLDTWVSTFYAHAQSQLKIIKQQLEEFVGTEEETRSYTVYNQYRDEIDENISKRFVLIVQRYEKLIWYKNEIDAIFNFSMSFQFFSSTVSVCLVVYKMTVTSVTSFQFWFLIVLFVILLTQVFLYCYFGNLLEFESRSVNTSLYKSDWISLSHRFRRQMPIAMIRWSRTMQPRVCYIIPLSLTTFITIVKSSYTLYTVLVTAKPKMVLE